MAKTINISMLLSWGEISKLSKHPFTAFTTVANHYFDAVKYFKTMKVQMSMQWKYFQFQYFQNIKDHVSTQDEMN